MKKNSNCRDNCVKLDGHAHGTIIDVSTKFEAIRRTFARLFFTEIAKGGDGAHFKFERGGIIHKKLKTGLFAQPNLKREGGNLVLIPYSKMIQTSI